MVKTPAKKTRLLDVTNYSQSDFKNLQDEAYDDEDKFQDRAVKEAWKKEKLRLNVEIGSKTMVIVLSIVTIEHAQKYAEHLMRAKEALRDTDECNRITDVLRQTEERNVPVTICEFIFLFFITAVCLFVHKRVRATLQRPMLWLYMSAVIVTSIYILFLGLPPWAPSCQDSIAMAACTAVEDSIWESYANTMDCSLQGYSMVMVHLVYLLLTPRLLPSNAWMNFNLVWIFGFNLGAQFVYNRIYPKILYNDLDTVITTCLLLMTHLIARQRKFYMMKSQFKKFVNDRKQKEASWKMFSILQYMVPPHVAVPMLVNPEASIAEDVNPVSILFVMIVDFDQYTRKYTPGELLAFLNKYFTLMDRSCELHSVTKIETVGEEYVAAVGVVPDDIKKCAAEGHGEALGRLIHVATDILQLQTSELEFKMGMHTGPIVAGVIGKKLPRFRLFGDTINTAARMMQKGEAGKLQFGEATKAELPEWVKVEPPRVIEMKGKGKVTAYFLEDDGAWRVKRLPTGATMHSASVAGFGTAISSSPSRTTRRVSFDASPTNDHTVDDHTFACRTTTHRGSLTHRGSDFSTALTHQPSRKRSLMHDEWFEMALDQLASTQKAQDTQPRQAVLGWLRVQHWTKSEEFTREMEEEWIRWHHENAICKKLVDRLDRQERLLAVITTIETIYLVASGTADRPSDSEYTKRLPFFLFLRFLAFGIIMLWRLMARSGGYGNENGAVAGGGQSPGGMQRMGTAKSERMATARTDQSSLLNKSLDATPLWMRNNPILVQRGITLSWMCIASLIVFSYDSLTYSYDFDNTGSIEQLTNEVSEFERMSNLPSLVIVPVYALLSTQHPLPFTYQLAFLGQAILLMVMLQMKLCAPNLKVPLQCKIFFVIDNLISALLSLSAERANRARFKSMRTLEDTFKRTEQILNTLMPLMVVEEIRDLPNNVDPPSHNYLCATIAQSDLCGFTKLASTRQPLEVVEFISELFGMFDSLTDDHGVYKVETVGDAYIAGQAEPPLTLQNKPTNVILFGFDMVRATQDWAKRRGWDVNCRVGVHTGECIGGIVGTGMQRYHLFGDLMTSLEVLESTAIEGKVQVSTDCKEAAQLQMVMDGLPADFIRFEEREGDTLKTSKGEVHHFEEVGGRTYIVMGDRKSVV